MRRAEMCWKGRFQTARTETDEGMARLSGTGLHDRRHRQSNDVIKAS